MNKAAKVAARKYCKGMGGSPGRNEYQDFLAGVAWVEPQYQELLKAASNVAKGSNDISEVKRNLERLRRVIAALS